jgi:hypothetical protein
MMEEGMVARDKIASRATSGQMIIEDPINMSEDAHGPSTGTPGGRAKAEWECASPATRELEEGMVTRDANSTPNPPPIYR